MDIDETLLRQEVNELTNLLHLSPEWSDTRNAILNKGLSLREVVLAGFYEDESENQYGCLVINANEIISFQINPFGDVSSWEEMHNLHTALKEWPALQVVLQ